MPGIVTAWLVGEGIIFWRNWKQNSSFPVPGQLIAASFIFAMLALLAEADSARPLATTMAWGFDIAALLNVLPQIATGGTNTTSNPVGSVASGATGAASSISNAASSFAGGFAAEATGGSSKAAGAAESGARGFLKELGL